MDELQGKITAAIKPRGAPIGFKLIEKKEQLDGLHVRPLEKNLALCQLLKLVSIYEKTRSVTFDNVDACVIGSYVMGFGTLPADLKDRWVKDLNYDDERFGKLVKGLHALSQGKYEAAIFGPLSEFQKLNMKPDGVVLVVNSAQAYLLLTGYFDATGKKAVSDFNGHAACEVVAATIDGKSPWLTVPCGGARSIGEAQDDELWVGMTVHELESAMARLSKMGSKYPPALYQMIMSPMDPEHPVTRLISR